LCVPHGERHCHREQRFLIFENGCTSAKIDLTIKPVGRYEKSERFRLILSDPKGGCRFDKKTDGGDACNILTVIIKPCSKVHNRTDKLMATLIGNWDKAQIGHSNWKDQFRDALLVNGDEEGEEPGHCLLEGPVRFHPAC